jgi:ferric-dicitrate binding protein FerR (iron transport regulator)
MLKEETKYTISDLLENESFIQSANDPMPESAPFRLSKIDMDAVNREDYDLALFIIRSLRSSVREKLESKQTENIWANIQLRVNNHKKTKRRSIYRRLFSTASVLILAGFFFMKSIRTDDVATETTTAKIDIENIEKPVYTSDDIQVIFSDDHQVILKEKEADIVYNDKGEAIFNSQTISQSKEADVSNENAYNQMIIPKGRHSSLTLSDGTVLWLNASSRVIYPPVFNQDVREIFIEGEAFLDVKPDAGRPFIVKTSRMEIQVTGTSLNISAYPEEDTQMVVLVSGSVKVKPKTDSAKETTLTPNQIFRLTGNVTTLDHVNVNYYISWKEGMYIYNCQSLSFILDRLGRYYGVDINFDPEVGTLKYSGKLDLKSNVERVLDGLKNTAPIRYTKQDKSYYLFK